MLGTQQYVSPTIPLARSPLGPVESAYQSCGPQIIPVAYGPPSKVIGQCMLPLPGTGVCVGAFESQWVDLSESDLPSCMRDENIVTGYNVVNMAPIARQQQPQQPPAQQKPQQQPAKPMQQPQQQPSVSKVPSGPVRGPTLPQKVGAVANRVLTTRDPDAQWQKLNGGEPSEGLRHFEHRAASLYDGAGSAYGPCASYGSYSAAPNAELSYGVGNSMMGSNATNWCNQPVPYDRQFMTYN